MNKINVLTLVYFKFNQFKNLKNRLNLMILLTKRKVKTLMTKMTQKKHFIKYFNNQKKNYPRIIILLKNIKAYLYVMVNNFYYSIV